jgi:hypothetical protein
MVYCGGQTGVYDIGGWRIGGDQEAPESEIDFVGRLDG